MKLFLLLSLFLYYQNHEASCFKVFKYMSDKMSDFRSSMWSVFNTFLDQFTFKFPMLDSEGVDKVRWDIKVKPFSDFVAKEAAKSEIDFPEYFRLRSEPTALMSTPQLANFHGKTVESHTVVTEDGYILTLHRLKSPSATKTKPAKGMSNLTILMHHGLLGSSADWILVGPKKSLAYKLSNAGCDVWLLNARGNYYSRSHTTLHVDSLKYWKFSWEQMGTYDLPAVVNYVKSVTNRHQLNFIGHSMGATAFLVMLAVKPKYNEFFRMGIFLAPLVYMTNISGPMRFLTESAKNPPPELRNFLGKGEFVPNRLVPLWIATKHCNGSDVHCSNPLLLLSSSMPEKNSWSKKFTARVLYHVPAGGSTDTILHYAAMVKTGEFHEFYDERKQYPLQQVSVPIAIFSSDYDNLATKFDVLRLYSNIRNPVNHYIIQGVKLTHMDFVWHQKADSLIFSKVIDTLQFS